MFLNSRQSGLYVDNGNLSFTKIPGRKFCQLLISFVYDARNLHRVLNFSGIRINRLQVETLEEVFRRVQFQEVDLEETFLDEPVNDFYYHFSQVQSSNLIF